MHDQEDKQAYLQRELEKAQEESGKDRAHIDSLETDVRALQDDIEQG